MSARKSSPKSRGLGRGFASLIGADAPNIKSMNAPAEQPLTAEPTTGLPEGPRRNLPVAYLEPGASQPRRLFDNESLEELSQSIAEKGVLQPLIVQQLEENKFAIVAGERRWRAAQKAGLHEVPVIIENLSETDAIEVALIENIQRSDLTAIEEATAYHHLMSSFGYTQNDVAKKVSKSRSHIANLLRLLTLPDSVIDMLQEGKITMGHARALIGHENAEKLAEKIVADGLNVRQTEALTAEPKGVDLKAPTPSMPKQAKDADTIQLEKQIAAILNMKVKLKHDLTGNGKIELSYDSLDQLDDFLGRIGANL